MIDVLTGAAFVLVIVGAFAAGYAVSLPLAIAAAAAVAAIGCGLVAVALIDGKGAPWHSER